MCGDSTDLGDGINRIRLEFKVNAIMPPAIRTVAVLIESDWNLKLIDVSPLIVSAELVLIESDWNLKPVLVHLTVSVPPY